MEAFCEKLLRNVFVFLLAPDTKQHLTSTVLTLKKIRTSLSVSTGPRFTIAWSGQYHLELRCSCTMVTCMQEALPWSHLTTVAGPPKYHIWIFSFLIPSFSKLDVTSLDILKRTIRVQLQLTMAPQLCHGMFLSISQRTFGLPLMEIMDLHDNQNCGYSCTRFCPENWTSSSSSMWWKLKQIWCDENLSHWCKGKINQEHESSRGMQL